RLDAREHVRVLVAAELAALALVRPRLVRGEVQVVRPSGNRVELALERGDPPAVRDVIGDDVELDVAPRGDAHSLDLDEAVRIDEVPVELAPLDPDHERVARGTRGVGPVDPGELHEHESDDRDQDHYRRHRPDQLEPGGTMNLRPLEGASAAAVSEADDEDD